jgi:hypothetical protein
MGTFKTLTAVSSLRVGRRPVRAPGFTTKYAADRLVHFEMFEDMPTAIAREKQIKSGSRLKKLKLIERTNPQWRDLFGDLICWAIFPSLQVKQPRGTICGP